MSTTEQIIFHPDLLVIPEDSSPPYLTAYKCEQCGKVWFPGLPVCPNCWCEKLVKIPVSRRGKLYSYTIIRVGQASLKPPYIVGFVDFPEQVRVCAQIEGDPERLKPDMEMEVTTGVIRTDEASGKPVVSYKFKPVE